MVGGVAGPLTEIDPVAERIRTAWRDLRRTGSTGPVRAFLYEPDPPLDVAQADALDLIVTHAPVRMSDVASLLRVEPSTATRTVAKLQQLDPQLPVVVMTAWGSVEGAVDAMRSGARDYVTKPWDNTRLVTTLRSHVELADALRKSRRLSAENERLQTRAPGMVAESRAMKAVLELVDRLEQDDDVQRVFHNLA